MAQKGPILVIMAAGMGSRYGGLKQMDPLGPDGSVILHYSIYDAIRAGFRRVVFLIKHEIEADFRAMVGDRVSSRIETAYAYQQLDNLPAPFTVPAGRVKPRGTGHAVLCCRELIDAPFAVINADDYYGTHAFREAYDALNGARDSELLEYMMVGYRLSNTTTASGYVARGVCEVSDDGFLRGITERTHIVESSDGPLFTEDGEHYQRLPADSLVSMNMWGFTPSLLDELAEQFPRFLAGEAADNPAKAEFFLPSAVNQLLQSGRARVRVLSSQDKWYGVTYQQDRKTVQDALRQMTDEGLYPNPLFPKQV